MADMDPTFFILGAAGLLLLVGRLLPLMMSEINAPAFDAQIEKLLQAGNRDRALKLCNAAPNAPYVAVIKAMLEQSSQLSADDGEGLISESIAEAHQREVEVQRRRVNRLSWLAPVGVMVAAGATFLALQQQESPPPEVFLPPIIAAPLWLACYRKARRLERAFATALDKLRPLMTAYVIENQED